MPTLKVSSVDEISNLGAQRPDLFGPNASEPLRAERDPDTEEGWMFQVPDHRWSEVEGLNPALSAPRLLRLASQMRKTALDHGIVFQGQIIPLDDTTRSAISEIARGITNEAISAPVPFRLSRGHYLTLSADDVAALDRAATIRVQACFAAEAAAAHGIGDESISDDAGVAAFFSDLN